MAEITVNKIKSIALLGHSAAGKTSLMDTIAYKLGVSERLGKVEEKTSLSDYDEEEKKRGISINLSVFPITLTVSKLNVFLTKLTNDSN